MSGLFTIDPVFPLWVIAITLIPTFAFFIWKEVRSNQRFTATRILAQLLVLISIVGIILRPSIQKEVSSSGILLLTEGYSKVVADSLLTKYPTLKVVRTTEAEAFNNSEIVPDNKSLSSFSEKIRFVTGSGLSPDELAFLQGEKFKFIPGNTPEGITRISVSNPVRTNHSATINGIINYTGAGTTLKLAGTGTEDSIHLGGKGITTFSFTIRPKQAGQFLYSLQTKDTAFVNEKLPIEILPEHKLNILFLQKFPTAETRYLKNFLAEQGHRILLRYQTSKTNFSYEYANTSPVPVSRLTSALTESIDLLFIDSSVLSELSSSETTILRDAIHNGLGMIILDLPEKSTDLNKFVSLTFKPLKFDTVHIHLGSSNQYTLPIQPINITTSKSIEATLTHNNKPLSGYSFKGAGKIAFQLLKETYRVRLEGNTDDYAFIWTPLVEKTARVKEIEFKMKLINSFPYYQDQSLDVEIISAGSAPTLLDGSIQLPTGEDVIIDDLWHSKTWASSPGWHHLSIKEDSMRLNYFVSKKNEWNALRIVNNMRATRLAESENEITSVISNSVETREISPLIFFLIFLFAAGFLWLAPKI